MSVERKSIEPTIVERKKQIINTWNNGYPGIDYPENFNPHKEIEALGGIDPLDLEADLVDPHYSDKGGHRARGEANKLIDDYKQGNEWGGF